MTERSTISRNARTALSLLFVGVLVGVPAPMAHGVAMAAPVQSSLATPALAVQDTVTAAFVDWGRELQAILESVSAIGESGLGDAEREIIMNDVLGLAPKFFLRRPPRASTRSYSFEMRFHGHVVPLQLAIESVDIGYVDMHFSSPDASLMSGIRQAIRAAHLSSLMPIGPTLLAVSESPGWNGQLPPFRSRS